MPPSLENLPENVINLPDDFISDGDGRIPSSSTGYLPDDGKLLYNIGGRLAELNGLAMDCNHKLVDYPQGYSGWCRVRKIGGPDRRIYGHTGKAGFFSSARLFAIHLMHIGKYRTPQGCQCTTCREAAQVTASKKRRSDALVPIAATKKLKANTPIDENEYQHMANSYDSDTVTEVGSIAINDELRDLQVQNRHYEDFVGFEQESGPRHQNAEETRRSSDPVVYDSIEQGEDYVDYAQEAAPPHECVAEGRQISVPFQYESIEQDEDFEIALQSEAQHAASSCQPTRTKMPVSTSEVRSTHVVHDLLKQARGLSLIQYLNVAIKPSSGQAKNEYEICCEEKLLYWHRNPNAPRQGETVVHRSAASDTEFATSATHNAWCVGVVVTSSIDSKDAQHVLVHTFGLNQEPQWFNTNDIIPLHAMPWIHNRFGSMFEQHLQALTCSYSVRAASRFEAERQQLHEIVSKVSYHGIYIENELVLVGDYVRLLPRPLEQDDTILTDIMLVSAIELNVVQYVDGHNTEHIGCHISGRVLTSKRARAFKINGRPQSCSDEEVQDILGDDGTLYWRTNPDLNTACVQVPITRVLGRYHNATCYANWHAAAGEKFIRGKANDSYFSFGLDETLSRRNAVRHHADSLHVKTWSWPDFGAVSRLSNQAK